MHARGRAVPKQPCGSLNNQSKVLICLLNEVKKSQKNRLILSLSPILMGSKFCKKSYAFYAQVKNREWKYMHQNVNHSYF